METQKVGRKAAVPESVVGAVESTSRSLEDLKEPFSELLNLFNPDVLSVLPPLERAECLFFLSRAISTIFTVKLRCDGIDPDDHPMKTELDRLSIYGDKLERLTDLSKAPLRPSTTINAAAAARFINHSLPDLNPDQKNNLKDIAQGRGRMKYVSVGVQKKRKVGVSRNGSVQNAVSDFLEKAARDLVHDLGNECRGPLQPDVSDSDD